MFHWVWFFVYLLTYYEVSPILHSVVDSQDEEQNGLVKTDNHHRLKRAWSWAKFWKKVWAGIKRVFNAIITKVKGGVVSRVNKAVEKSRPKRSIDEVDAIDATINYNYEGACKFKEELSKISPEEAKHVYINPDGVTCNQELCDAVGDGIGSIGICTPNICMCLNGLPIHHECVNGTVFDLVGQKCAFPEELEICGYY